MGHSFDDLVREAEAVPIDGWDFGWLAGRAFEARPSWHYFDLVAERARTVTSLLDLEVGSGGMIAALPVIPPLTVGTEGYAPNVPGASANLARRGARLVWPDSAQRCLPLRTNTFELVTSRHPVTTWWSEIARVLAPGGAYLSQQVGPYSVRTLSEYLMGPLPPGSERTPEAAEADARAAGLEVRTLRSERPATEFYDIGAVVYYLRLVVWIVPDFSVDRYRDELRRLHEQIESDGSFATTASRFLIEAVKPDRQ
ncbi:MAG TPA: SAM-dependent methyltransferase [Acidimicrobiia bacterium]|jgi:SAM-dependent methyltransferase